MKISVILATYNRESTVVRALLSIKGQTYSDIQVIVIDGASNDNTISLVKPLLNKGDILKSEPDLGVYDALNKGLALAEGETIAFLHSDDIYFDENVISQVVKKLSDYSVDLVYGDVTFFTPKKPTKVIRKYRSDMLSKRNLAWGRMPAHPAMFIRKRVYDKVGSFRTDFNIAGDYEFLCRVVNLKNLRSSYTPAIFVRMQMGGVSTSGIRNTFLLNKEVLRALKENNIYTNIFMLLSKYPSKILQFLLR